MSSQNLASCNLSHYSVSCILPLMQPKIAFAFFAATVWVQSFLTSVGNCLCLIIGNFPLLLHPSMQHLFIYFIYIPPHSRSSLGGLQKLKTISIKTNIQNFKPEKLKNMNIQIKTTILFLGSAKRKQTQHMLLIAWEKR